MHHQHKRRYKHWYLLYDFKCVFVNFETTTFTVKEARLTRHGRACSRARVL